MRIMVDLVMREGGEAVILPGEAVMREGDRRSSVSAHGGFSESQPGEALMREGGEAVMREGDRGSSVSAHDEDRKGGGDHGGCWFRGRGRKPRGPTERRKMSHQGKS